MRKTAPLAVGSQRPHRSQSLLISGRATTFTDCVIENLISNHLY